MVYPGTKLLVNSIFPQYSEDIIFMVSRLQCVDFEQSDTCESHWQLSGEGSRYLKGKKKKHGDIINRGTLE